MGFPHVREMFYLVRTHEGVEGYIRVDNLKFDAWQATAKQKDGKVSTKLRAAATRQRQYLPTEIKDGEVVTVMSYDLEDDSLPIEDKLLFYRVRTADGVEGYVKPENL